ncbi:MAG: transglycosylase domain-containing protein [Janthinobacterium lividum]
MAGRRPAPTPTKGPQRGPTRRPRRRRVVGWLFGIVLTGLVLAVGGFAAAYAVVDVPDPNDLADAQISTIYYSDGATPIGTFAARNRENVTIDQVPLDMQHAVLSAEDRGFYENRGVSPTGIARAVWNNLSGGSQQGGSTLTQQYVKNYYLTDERSYRRKFEEFFISLKIDQQQSKDETLVDYLNTVYFGRGAYGVQAASRAYFGVDVSQVNASQAALLAAVLKAPGNYDPRKSEAAAASVRQRVDYVLDGMVTEGWLSQADRDGAGLPDTIVVAQDDSLGGTKGYLLTTVQDELTKTVGLSEDEIDRGGLKITTTFDVQAQADAVAAVQDQLPAKLPVGFHVALSAIDPATGGVTAMYGGADYLTNNYNEATKATAQAGSTFKPFALVAGLEQGISLRTTFSGASPQQVAGAPFDNFGDEQYGRINLIQATEHSVNTVYAQLNEKVTPTATRDVAVAAGYPRDTSGLDDAHTTISNVLGTASPHPIDVTQAYATFAARGTHRQWHTIAAIDDTTGTRTYTASPSTEQAFSTDVAADATYAMEQVVQSGTGSYAKRLNRPAAGKTGTSSGNESAWFAGFTPQLAASVALFQTSADGKQNETIHLGGREVTGGSYPVRIWTAFMRAALDGTEKKDFPDPVYLGSSRGSGSTSDSTPTRTRTQSPTETATQTPTVTDSPTQTPSDSPTSGETTSPAPSGSSSASSSPSGSASSSSSGGDGGDDPTATDDTAIAPTSGAATTG